MRVCVCVHVRAEPTSNLYFEVRHSKNGRLQPTKYWATIHIYMCA